MLRDKAIHNKLLVVLGLIIALQASVIGWSVISPAAATEVKQPHDFQVLAVHGLGSAVVEALCDTERGNLIYFGAMKGSIHLAVVENGCPNTPKGT